MVSDGWEVRQRVGEGWLLRAEHAAYMVWCQQQPSRDHLAVDKETSEKLTRILLESPDLEDGAVPLEGFEAKDVNWRRRGILRVIRLCEAGATEWHFQEAHLRTSTR